MNRYEQLINNELPMVWFEWKHYPKRGGISEDWFCVMKGGYSFKITSSQGMWNGEILPADGNSAHLPAFTPEVSIDLMKESLEEYWRENLHEQN